MEANGFHWEDGWSGEGSGGSSDSGGYIKADRKLELHFRWSLGMVTYHIGPSCILHKDYMWSVAGKGNASYPGFSKNPIDGFRHLAEDLKKYGADFLSGSGAEFENAFREKKRRDSLSGFQKLSSK